MTARQEHLFNIAKISHSHVGLQEGYPYEISEAKIIKFHKQQFEMLLSILMFKFSCLNAHV